MKAQGVIDYQHKDEEIIGFYNKWIYSFNLLVGHKQATAVKADVVIFDCEAKNDMDILSLLGVRHASKEIWKNHFSGDLMIRSVKGNHWSMFGDRENVRYLAKAFESVI